jgi:hypothetical protein
MADINALGSISLPTFASILASRQIPIVLAGRRSCVSELSRPGALGLGHQRGRPIHNQLPVPGSANPFMCALLSWFLAITAEHRDRGRRKNPILQNPTA